MVAQKLSRRAVLIDLNPDYLEQIEKRFDGNIEGALAEPVIVESPLHHMTQFRWKSLNEPFLIEI